MKSSFFIHDDCDTRGGGRGKKHFASRMFPRFVTAL
jgi:hypothetical protein